MVQGGRGLGFGSESTSGLSSGEGEEDEDVVRMRFAGPSAGSGRAQRPLTRKVRSHSTSQVGSSDRYGAPLVVSGLASDTDESITTAHASASRTHTAHHAISASSSSGLTTDASSSSSVAGSSSVASASASESEASASGAESASSAVTPSPSGSPSLHDAGLGLGLGGLGLGMSMGMGSGGSQHSGSSSASERMTLGARGVISRTISSHSTTSSGRGSAHTPDASGARSPRLLSVQTVPLPLKDRTQSAEGVLLAVQSKHQEAMAQIAAARKAGVTSLPNSPSLGGFSGSSAGEETDQEAGGTGDTVDDEGRSTRTLVHFPSSSRGTDTVRSRASHRSGRSEIGLETARPHDEHSAGSGTDGEAPSARPQTSFPFAAVVTTTSPPPMSSPLEVTGSATSGQTEPATAVLRRSHTTAGISTWDSDGPLARQQRQAAASIQQQGGDQRPRMESFRDLVSSSTSQFPSANLAGAPGSAKSLQQQSSYKSASIGRMTPSASTMGIQSALSATAAPGSAGPVIPVRRPRLSLQGGFSSTPNVPTSSSAKMPPMMTQARDESVGRRSADLLRVAPPGGAAASSNLVRSHSAQGATKQPIITIDAASGNAAMDRRRTRTGLQTALEAKVVILGSQGVGKTSLVHRYTTGQFNAGSMPSTIGASFATKRLIVDGTKVRLQLWDTAGQERFRSMAPMYYRGSHAAVVVYDITNRRSLEELKSWIEELRTNMGEELTIHIVGAKADLTAARQVT